MKKKILLMLCMLLTAAMCACTDSGAALPEQPKTLRLATLSNVNAYLEDAVAEYNENNAYGVSIALETYSMEQYKQMLSMAAAADEMPDLFFTWEAGYLKPYVSNGKVLPLTGYLESENWMDTFLPGVLDSVCFDGQVYAVPLQRSIVVTYYNREVFDRAGLAVPETWTDFREVCRELKRMGITPLSIGTDAWESGQLLTAIMVGTGGSDLYAQLAQGDDRVWDDLLDANRMLEELYEKGYVLREEKGGRALREGSAGMYLNGDWLYDRFCNSPEIGAFLLPACNLSWSHTAIESVDQCYGISAACAEPEAACAFLRLLTDRTHQDALEELSGQRCTTLGCSYGQASPLQQQISDLCASVSDRVIWIDRGISGEMGTAFNDMAMEILNGRDSETALEHFQKTIKQ